MRKISATLKLLGLLTPLGAHALGIGEIKLYSALNQAFNAEIPLVISGTDSLSQIKVSLASQEAFNKAGIERNYSLSKLRFKSIQKQDGSAVIQVSSVENIREPFLNFLIEVSGSEGQMLREFTVLLDPPTGFNDFESIQRTETPKPFKTEAVKPSIAPQPLVKIDTTNEAYGPIRRDETLWSVAKRLNPDSSKVSHERMLEALYQANPEAFQNNDINSMKAGSLLKIPDLHIPRAQENPIQGKPNHQAQLKLLSPGDLAAKPNDLLESSNSIKQENEALHSKLIELESQLATLKQSLSEKEAIIAKLTPAHSIESKPEPETEIVQAPNIETVSQPIISAPVIEKPLIAEPPPPLPVKEPGFSKSLAIILSALFAPFASLGFYFYRKKASVKHLSDKYFDANYLKQEIYQDTQNEKLKEPEFQEESESKNLTDDTSSKIADPIAEADVYLGYGRHKQAEAFMLKAIAQNPDRDDYRLKLLEIYYVTENLSAFESYAQNLFAEGKACDDVFWDKVIEMGLVLCPQSALFRTSEEIDSTSDLLADLKRFEERYIQPLKESVEPINPVAIDQSIEEPQILDFESPSLQDIDSEINIASDPDEELNLKLNVLDHNPEKTSTEMLDLKEQETYAPLEFDAQSYLPQEIAVENEIEYENLISFDIKPLDTPKESPSIQVEETFDFDIERLIPLDNSIESSNQGEDYSDLTDMDEQETKLDLAKAYIDMGDEKTANEILEDVLIKGNAEQKKEAELYLAKIASDLSK